MWLRRADNVAFGLYVTGMLAALADLDTCRRMIEDLAAAFGNVLVSAQGEMDQDMAQMREWHDRQDRAE